MSPSLDTTIDVNKHTQTLRNEFHTFSGEFENHMKKVDGNLDASGNYFRKSDTKWPHAI